MRRLSQSLNNQSARLLLATLLSLLLGACPAPHGQVTGSAASLSSVANSGRVLNSDNILKKFGSYGVKIIRQDELSRVSSLYSENDNGSRITRTLAIVLFSDDALTHLAREQQIIREGGSIGITFRNANWTIHKKQLLLANIDLRTSSLLRELMPEADLSVLAISIYEFLVARDGAEYRYATIAEIHHPDYMTLNDLQSQIPAGTTAAPMTELGRNNLLQTFLPEIHR